MTAEQVEQAQFVEAPTLDEQARMQKCMEEVNEVLNRHNCILGGQPLITQDGRIVVNVGLVMKRKLLVPQTQPGNNKPTGIHADVLRMPRS